MKFSEIKHKIKNLGEFKSLEEIKKAGLRIVRNTKTGDYWLIEEEFLKPVIKSPRECKSILIKPEDLKYKVLMVHKSKKELKEKKVLDYIMWGEKQGFHKRPTCKNRKKWWDINEIGVGDFLWPNAFNDRFAVFLNQGFRSDMRIYLLILRKKEWSNIIFSLNSVLNIFNIELFGILNLGEGVIYTNVYQVPNNFLVIPEFVNDEKLELLRNYKPKSIFTELGFDPKRPIREQEPKPLPDRKALDDIVFDALGLTEEERKEVYWAVAELVKNRLDKAKSV